MHRYIADIRAYDLFNNISTLAVIVSSLFYFKTKRKSIGLYSRLAIHFSSRRSALLGKNVEIILVSLESLVLAGVTLISPLFNKPFGNLVGTGVNYFGLLSTVSLILFIASLVLMANPLKQIDIATMFLPVHLFFIKIACFCQGCCWGIPWEYGPYNHRPGATGNQVPVQAIEVFWAMVIFIFLLKYRKKAKTGTMFPMYMLLYCSTRFCSEFLRREQNVWWIFKTYHLLCLTGIAVALLMLLFVKLFGDKLSVYFDNLCNNFELKVVQKEELKAIKLAEEKAQAEAAEIERLEKVRRAREKAKARRKK